MKFSCAGAGLKIFWRLEGNSRVVCICVAYVVHVMFKILPPKFVWITQSFFLVVLYVMQVFISSNSGYYHRRLAST